MAIHSSPLAWKIPWTEEPGRLQSMGSLGVRRDWATSLSLFTFLHWRRKWQPTPVFLPGESLGWGAWWAAVYGVAHSRIRLKRLSSSSSSRDAAREGSLKRQHLSRNLNEKEELIMWGSTEEGAANARDSECDVFESLAELDLGLECIELGGEGRQRPDHDRPCRPGRDFIFYFNCSERY